MTKSSSVIIQLSETSPCTLRTQSLSPIQLFAVLWKVAHQTCLSVAFFRQEYWSRLPFPPPGDPPNPGIEPMFLASPALANIFFTHAPPGKSTPPQNTLISLTTGAKKGPYTDLHSSPLDPSHKKFPTNLFSVTVFFLLHANSSGRPPQYCLHCNFNKTQLCDRTIATFKPMPPSHSLNRNLKWDLENDKHIS